MLVYDSMTMFFRMFLLAFAFWFIILVRITGLADKQDGQDFYTLLLGATLGMCLMASANHLMTIFLSVEMASVPSYVLAGILKGRRRSSEASLKYAVYGAGTAGVMLYGISLLAGVLGSVHMPTMAARLVTMLNAGIPMDTQMVLALGALRAESQITDAFRTGTGMGWHEHHEDVFTGCEMFFRPGYVANLVSSWIPALDGVAEKLTAGGRVADIGCGCGASTVLLAQAYPKSGIQGSDYHQASVDIARKRAADAGVADRARFEVASAQTFSGTGYDLIATFDCLHDMGDPAGAARHIRQALDADGTCSGPQTWTRLAVNVPVFVEPPTAGKVAGAIGGAEARAGFLTFSLANTGNVHFKNQSVAVKALGPNAQPLFTQYLEAWYVLPGEQRTYRLELPRETCRQIRVVTISVGRESSIREITVEVRDSGQAEVIAGLIGALEEVRVLWHQDRALLRHRGGKLEIDPVHAVRSVQEMRDVYTPGVARVCMAIHHDPEKAYTLTVKQNSVAVVTDGSAVLGLGEQDEPVFHFLLGADGIGRQIAQGRLEPADEPLTERRAQIVVVADAGQRSLEQVDRSVGVGREEPACLLERVIDDVRDPLFLNRLFQFFLAAKVVVVHGGSDGGRLDGLLVVSLGQRHEVVHPATPGLGNFGVTSHRRRGR